MKISTPHFINLFINKKYLKSFINPVNCLVFKIYIKFLFTLTLGFFLLNFIILLNSEKSL